MTSSEQVTNMISQALSSRASNATVSSTSMDAATESAIIIGVVMFLLAVPGTVTAVLAIKTYRRSKSPRVPNDLEASHTTEESAVSPPAAPAQSFLALASESPVLAGAIPHPPLNVSTTTINMPADQPFPELPRAYSLATSASDTRSDTTDAASLYPAGGSPGEDIKLLPWMTSPPPRVVFRDRLFMGL